MTMSWGALGYAALCVVIPALWGIAVVWASNRIERVVLRRSKGSAERRRPLPPIEYHI